MDLNNVTWGEFKVEDIFLVENVNKLFVKGKNYVMDKDVISERGTVPYIAAISINNGITGYSNYAANNDGDCITLSTTADSSNTVFYQEQPFIGRQQIAGIRRKEGKLGKYAGLFIASIVKRITCQFNYSNKLTKEYLRNCIISLPITSDGTPDWQFMEDYISELEQERISELDAYLKTTGLEDYELNEDDKEILAAAIGGAKSPSRMCGGCSRKWVREFKEFKIGELFQILTPKKRFNANTVEIAISLGYPYVVRTSNNNGIRGYIEESETFLNAGNTFSFGQDTATVFWQREPYFTGDKVKVLKPCFKCNDKIAQFLLVAIQKPFSNFSWGSQSFKTSVIENTNISLPILPDGTPDFEYMERYIKAIEKVVIADVVEYKNNVIQKTKKVVEEPAIR